MAIPSSDTKITPFRNDRPVEGSRDAPLRALPHNIEAEQGLLGSLLRNNRAYEKVAEFLRPDHFANVVHGRIYEALGRLIDRGQIADPVEPERGRSRAAFRPDELMDRAKQTWWRHQMQPTGARTKPSACGGPNCGPSRMRMK